jgi:hypothetical protein
MKPNLYRDEDKECHHLRTCGCIEISSRGGLDANDDATTGMQRQIRLARKKTRKGALLVDDNPAPEADMVSGGSTSRRLYVVHAMSLFPYGPF